MSRKNKRKSHNEVALVEKSAAVSQLASPDCSFLAMFGSTPSTSGINVSPANAMRCTPVRAAVLAISEALGQIEAHIYTTGDKSEIAVDHPAYSLLNNDVNPWTSASAFREALTRDACLYGNGFASITRDDDGNPIELHRMRPESVAVLINLDTLEPSYRWTPLNGSEQTFAFSDVIHLRASSCDGILGESPVMQCREAIGLALSLEAHAGRLFSNGARPSGVFEHPEKMGPDAATRLKAQVDASRGTLVLEEGMKFNQVALTSTDGQFLENRDFQIKEIARAFRVNPILLGEMGRATFANAAETGRQFIQYTLSPWVMRWQGEIAIKLLRPEERTAYRIELDTDGFDRDGIAARMTAYSSAVAARVMCPNECRAVESLPPYDGGEKFENPNVTTGTVRVG